MTLELPRWLMADLLSLGLIACGGVALELTVARYPGLPQGPGVLAAAALALWQWRRGRVRPRVLVLAPQAVAVLTPGSDSPAAATGPRARVLGRSVLLHWREGRRSGTAWLTRLDAPPGALRHARVCCRTHDHAPVPGPAVSAVAG